MHVLEDFLHRLEEHIRPTASLLIRYLHFFRVLKCFVRARAGDLTKGGFLSKVHEG